MASCGTTVQILRSSASRPPSASQSATASRPVTVGYGALSKHINKLPDLYTNFQGTKRLWDDPYPCSKENLPPTASDCPSLDHSSGDSSDHVSPLEAWSLNSRRPSPTVEANNGHVSPYPQAVRPPLVPRLLGQSLDYQQSDLLPLPGGQSGLDRAAIFGTLPRRRPNALAPSYYEYGHHAVGPIGSSGRSSAMADMDRRMTHDASSLNEQSSQGQPERFSFEPFQDATRASIRSLHLLPSVAHHERVVPDSARPARALGPNESIGLHETAQPKPCKSSARLFEAPDRRAPVGSSSHDASTLRPLQRDYETRGIGRTGAPNQHDCYESSGALGKYGHYNWSSTSDGRFRHQGHLERLDPPHPWNSGHVNNKQYNFMSQLPAQHNIAYTNHRPNLAPSHPSVQPSLVSPPHYEELPEHCHAQRVSNTASTGRHELSVLSMPFRFPASHQGHQLTPPDAFTFSHPPLDSSQRIRSALLNDFKTDRGIKKWELHHVYGHVVEFCGDQQGSKFIQAKLEVANSEQRARVFEETLPNALQLTNDVFGNWLMQKLFQHGDQYQKKMLANEMSGRVLTLSRDVYGCRVLQTALEYVLEDQKAAFAKELEGHVMPLIKDKNGNHVIQKVIKTVKPQYTQVIVEVCVANLQEIAVHQYGCRVVQRLLEFYHGPWRGRILHILYKSSLTLLNDVYGNYVAQYIIEEGAPDDRATLMRIVCSNAVLYSKQRFASNVVEKSIKHGTEDQRQDIMFQLSSRDDHGDSLLFSLIKDSFANYVIQTLLDTLNDTNYSFFVSMLEPELARVKRSAPHNKQADNVYQKMLRVHRTAIADFLPRCDMPTIMV